MRRLDAFRSRPTFQFVVVVLFVVFLAWFAMKFYMDTSNDSETEAYIRGLTASATHGTLAIDARGHYTALAPYVLWPFTATLQRITAGYEIRGFVFARLFVGAALYAAAYVWYRRIGLGWLTSLFGLILLSTSCAFALLISGWELDKVIEPALFMLAAVAAWNRRYVSLLGIAALAAANRETGIFVPLVALAGLAREAGVPAVALTGLTPEDAGPLVPPAGLANEVGVPPVALAGLRRAVRHWPFWGCVIVCAVEVVWLRMFVSTPAIVVLDDLRLDRLVGVIGGLCLLPLLAVASVRAAPLDLRRLFYLVAPAWVALVLGIDRLDQGALLLTPLALLCIPVTLAAVEQALREQIAPRARLPAAPAER